MIRHKWECVLNCGYSVESDSVKQLNKAIWNHFKENNCGKA